MLHRCIRNENGDQKKERNKQVVDMEKSPRGLSWGLREEPLGENADILGSDIP